MNGNVNQDFVLQHQINQLKEVLETKGLNKVFTINGNFPDQFDRSIRNFIKENGTNIKALKEFELFTYTHFNKDGPRVGLHMKTSYNPSFGFNISQIKALHWNQSGELVNSKEIKPRSHDQIPTRAEINFSFLSAGQEESMGIKKNLKF